MPVQEALDFIREVAADPALRRAVEEVPGKGGLNDLVRIGSEHGFRFSVEELRVAYSRDCAMRRAYFGSGVRSAQSGRNSR